MEETARQASLGEIYFLFLLGFSVHIPVLILYRLYPFPYDRAAKRRRINTLLLLNLLISVGILLTLAVGALTEIIPVRISDKPQHFLWVLLGVVATQAVMLQAPALFIAKALDRQTNTAFDNLTTRIIRARFGVAEQRELRELYDAISFEEASLRDYGLHDLAAKVTDPELATFDRDAGEFLLARIDEVRTRITRLDSPFAELNRIVSIAGATALAFAATFLN